MVVLKQHHAKILDDNDDDSDQEQRTPCALLEKIPVEMQKMIMEYVLDFTTPPVYEDGLSLDDSFDCFGLTIGYKNQAYVLFMPLESAHQVMAVRESMVKYVSVRSLCAPLQISRTLLAPTLEAMLGHGPRKFAEVEGSKSVQKPSPNLDTIAGPRTRFWDNDFYFPNGCMNVLHFLKANVNRRTYIERFAMTNDCWPKADVNMEHGKPEDFFAIFEELAFGKGTRVLPFMVVCQDPEHPTSKPLRKHFGVVTFDELYNDRRSCVFVHRRPWLGAGSCSPSFPRYGTPEVLTDHAGDDAGNNLLGGLDRGCAIHHEYDQIEMQNRWTYIQYDVNWAELYQEDVRILLGQQDPYDVGEIFRDIWLGHDLPIELET
ncbi:hypothetical protein LTS10_004615 [Elasticomyces elasticus]|nr:hypothetical protein LTS10_004615 [Elasticomyces elasticus]